MNLEFVPESSSMLLQPSKEFDFANPPFDPKEFAESLYNTMARHDGLGLSAVQVGHPYRVFAMRNERRMLEFSIIVFECEATRFNSHTLSDMGKHYRHFYFYRYDCASSIT